MARNQNIQPPNPGAYRLIRSNRRTLALEVTRQGEVLVRAPQRLSQARIDAFVMAHGDWIQRKVAVAQQRATPPEPTPEEIALFRQQAADFIPGRVVYYAQQMDLTPGPVRISLAKTRWGSCGAKGSLNFSWRLMQCPPEAIDYVVVHELAHIRHRNHGPQFWAEVARYMPDYSARKKMLR